MDDTSAKERGAESAGPRSLAAERRSEMRYDLVLEGGGVKGIALVGALAVLEERGYRSQRVAGTSAGAIVAALHGAGYSSAELKEIISALDFGSFRDLGFEDRIPFVGKALSVLMDKGIYEGEAFLAWMRERLEVKGVRTFADLVRDGGEPKVQVIVSDLTGRRLLVLPSEAEELGVAPDDLEVALAVRMSMSIPLYFEPVTFRHGRSRRRHLLVDGGMLSNFPVWLFDAQGAIPAWPTFGLALVDDLPGRSLADGLSPLDDPEIGILDYLKSLVQTMMEAHDRLYLEKADFARTITIPTLGISGVDFGLSTEDALRLYDSGRRAAEAFLAGWDFHGYIEAFRTPTRALAAPSRRAEVVREMREAARAAGG